jgi:hypothetical protein
MPAAITRRDRSAVCGRPKAGMKAHACDVLIKIHEGDLCVNEENG